MPVFWFALSFVQQIDWYRAITAFFLIHFLLYPSSNGYNSFMDRDTESIGGVEKPMQPTHQLFYVTVAMDVLGIILSFLVSWQFAAGYIIYVVCSRLYSYKGVRLKRFPVIGYMVVVLNQGSLIFAMTFAAADPGGHMPVEGLVAAAFLIGGFYPITQIYQHNADAADGVRTISMLLGKRGTFLFCVSMYAIAFGILFYYYGRIGRLQDFLILQLFFLAVVIYFIRWMLQVWNNDKFADFRRTMRMNLLASTCTNFAFITLILIHWLK